MRPSSPGALPAPSFIWMVLRIHASQRNEDYGTLLNTHLAPPLILLEAMGTKKKGGAQGVTKHRRAAEPNR